MGKKKFEEVEYDPIETEARRALARAVSQPGTSQPPRMFTTQTSNVVPLSSEVKKSVEQFGDGAGESREDPFKKPYINKANNIIRRREKRRSFSCANLEQDLELDAFLQRLKEFSGTHVPFQVIMRAACVVTMRAEEQILAETRKLPAPPLPAKFAHVEYAQFEEYWIEVVANAMRKVRPLQ